MFLRHRPPTLTVDIDARRHRAAYSLDGIVNDRGVVAPEGAQPLSLSDDPYWNPLTVRVLSGDRQG